MCTPENAICTLFSAAANTLPERLRAICPDGLSFLLMKACGFRLNNTDFITTTITPAGKTAAVFFIMYTQKQENTQRKSERRAEKNYAKYTK